MVKGPRVAQNFRGLGVGSVGFLVRFLRSCELEWVCFRV